MPKFTRQRVAADNPVVDVWIQDSASATNDGKTGLTSGSAGLKISVKRELDAAPTVYTQAGGTIEGITTIGVYAAPTATKVRFKEIDAANMPGWYQLHFAQAMIGTADASRTFNGMLLGAAGMLQCPFEIELTGNVPQSGDSYAEVSHATYGLSKLVRSLTPANALAVDANNRVDLGKWLGTAVTLTGGKPDVHVAAMLAAVQSALAAAIEAAMVNEGDATALLQAIANKIGSDSVELAAIANAVRNVLVAGAPAGSLGAIAGALSARLPASGTLPIASELPSLVAFNDATNAIIAAMPDTDAVEGFVDESTRLIVERIEEGVDVQTVKQRPIYGTGVFGDRFRFTP